MAHGGTNVSVIILINYMQGKNMSKNKVRKLIIIGMVMAFITMASLIIPSLPYVKRESKEEVTLYVNPIFKIANYNSYYYEFERGGAGHFFDRSFDDIGLKLVNKSEFSKQTLYIMEREEKGFGFPPIFAFHRLKLFFFWIKTVTIEIHDSQTYELLLKAHYWRGIFNNGDRMIDKIVDSLDQGLGQAGWKERCCGS